MDACVEAAVRKNTPFNRLNGDLKQHFGQNEREYCRAVLQTAVKHQMKWDGLVKQIQKDREAYYAKVLEYSREHLMLFPYHLSGFVIREMRITPFQYYVQMVQGLTFLRWVLHWLVEFEQGRSLAEKFVTYMGVYGMGARGDTCDIKAAGWTCTARKYLFSTEQSYDQLPNFTAADCLRVLGIGRNQYIEKMNQSRSKKLFRKRSAADVMPTVPVDDALIEPWWIVYPGCILTDDVKTLGADERAVVDRLIGTGPQKAGKLPLEALKKIYVRGLVYLHVPVGDSDCICVPPLEGFVMNRVLGDYLETLLYKVFISIDEYTPVCELAEILEISLDEVKNAISIFCRLGFAKVKGIDMDPAELDLSWQRSSSSVKSDDENSSLPDNLDPETASLASTPAGPSPAFRIEDEVTTPGLPLTKRIGFIFDSTLTAFLMMGNLSPGLKNHAVTMFEVGKLTDESLDSFLSELEKVVPEEEIQGEAKRYFDHAINLRQLLRFLRHNPAVNVQDPLGPEQTNGLGVDLLRCESLRGLDRAALNRVLKRNYSLLISLAPMSNEARPVCPLIPPHVGCPVSEAHTIWFKLFVYSLTNSHPHTILYKRGSVLNTLPRPFLRSDYLLLTPWCHDSAIIPGCIALCLVNDALKHHAILLQTYGVSQDSELVYVPFPGRPFSGNIPPTSFENHSAVKKLREALQLDATCGYITLLNIASKKPSHPVNGLEWESAGDAERSSGNVAYDHVKMEREEDWVLLDCTYGLPVFSAALSNELCRRVVDQNIFSTENLGRLENMNRLVGQQLLEFIIKHQDLPLEVSSALGPSTLELDGKECESALPTRNIGIRAEKVH